MSSRIHRILAPPRFPDDGNKTRAAALLHTILLAGIAVDIGMTLVLVAVEHIPTVSIGLNAALGIIFFALWGWMRTGHVYASSAAFVGLAWLYITSILHLYGGMHSAIYSSFFALILLAAMLLGRRGAALTIMLAGLSTLAAVIGEARGVLPPPPFATDSIQNWLVFMANLAVFSVLINLGIHMLTTALKEARGEIIERRRTEQELERQRALLERVMETSPIAITVINNRHEYTFANSYAIHALGMEKLPGDDLRYREPNWRVTDYAGRPIPKGLGTFSLVVGKAEIASGIRHALEWPDGRRTFLLTNAAPLRGENDQVEGMVMASADVTQAILDQRQLVETAEKLRAIFETVEDGIGVIAVPPRFLQVNQALARLHGFTRREDLLERNPMELVARSNHARLMADMKQVYAGGHSGVHEYKLLRQDGSTFDAEMSVSAIRDAHGQITGLVAVARDVTYRKYAEEQIQRQVQRLAALREIDHAISANFDLESMLEVITAHVQRQLQVDAVCILLLDASGWFECAASRGYRRPPPRRMNLPLQNSIAGRAILEQPRISVPDLRTLAAHPVSVPLIAEEGFVSYHAVPLTVKGQVKGLLEVFNRQSYEPAEEWWDFFNALAGQAALAVDNAQMFEDLQRSNLELQLAYDQTLEGWARTLDLRDKKTEEHAQRVIQLALRLARALGVPDNELVHIRRGALLHDIGKMAIPDHILFKQGPLTPEECVIMRKHPEYAYNMLAPIKFLGPALDIPYCHHERLNGTGYPRRLKGEEIPLAARIFAVVDVWDALRSDRPYRPGWPDEKVRAHLVSARGIHFEAHIVDTFLKVLDQD